MPTDIDITDFRELEYTSKTTGPGDLKVNLLSCLESDAGNYLLAIKVNAPKLDSVELDNGPADYPLKNYRFESDNKGSLFSSADRISINYVYRASSLKENEFYIIYLVTAPAFDHEFTVELSNFGLYPFPVEQSETEISINTLYQGIWKVNCKVDE